MNKQERSVLITRQYIEIGVSTDSGYARLLDKYIGDRTVENRITLLKGPTFSKELLIVSDRFKTTSFPQVLRNAKIEIVTQNSAVENRRGCASHHSMAAESKSPEDRFLESLDYGRRKSYGDDISGARRGREENNGRSEHGRRASLRDYESGSHPNGEERGALLEAGKRRSLRECSGGTHSTDEARGALSDKPFSGSGYHSAADAIQRVGGRQSKKRESGTIAYPPEYFIDAPFGFIARNRFGQRVDVPLTQPAPGMITEIKRRKICNDYCLRGKCPNFHCKHEHPKRLSQMELHVLRDVARSFPCPAGLDCLDKNCFHGHRCPVDPCGFVQDRICRYPPELHGTDNSIVNKEDLDRFKGDSYDESHILGVRNKSNIYEPMTASLEARRVRTGEPLYRNLSMTFETTSDNGSRKESSESKGVLTGPMPPPIASSTSNFRNGHSTVSSESTVPRTIINLEDAGPTTNVPISPLKRTADEAGHELRAAVSPPRDPRLGAQKRAREVSA